MQSRAQIPVSVPHPSPTASYWQEPPSPLATHRSTLSLPPQVDYAIVGSGISGASIAHNLLTQQPAAKVLLLEARTAASGATGRNGGHTKAASYRTYPTHVQQHGAREAVRIAKLEHANVKAMQTVARDLQLDCDTHPSLTVDVIYDAEQWEGVQDTVREMNEGINGGVERYRLVGAEEVRRRFLCDGAIGGVEYGAGSVSGYKFTVGLLQRCLDKGLNLQTITPVMRLSGIPTNSNGARWMLHTPRGTTAAETVILATNGYTPALVKQLQGTIVPLRGQMSAQRPGSRLPSPLDHTYTFSYDTGYEYMITRPAGTTDAGTVLIGGGWAQLPEGGASEFGLTDDSVIEPRVSKYLTESLVRYFGSNWGRDSLAEGGRVKNEWTGIMGASADGVPYVGSMPGWEGVWVSASFNGHGMVMCLLCAEALVRRMIVGGWPEWFPKSFEITKDRMEVSFEGRRDVKPPPSSTETETGKERLEAEGARNRL